MQVIPAIDILDGQCVRLYQGNFSQVTCYHDYPKVIASHYANQGAQLLHMVDLNGAREGKISTLALLKEICQEQRLEVQVGGGIRTLADIEQRLQAGAKRVVLGSVAVTQPHMVMQWLTTVGPEKIVLALDVRVDNHNQPWITTHGWQKQSALTLWRLVSLYQASALKYILCTDVNRDGSFQGPNVMLYQACVQRFPQYNWQASGGIATLQDLKQLNALPLAGAVVGKALYENRFTLQEALREVAAC